MTDDDGTDGDAHNSVDRVFDLLDELERILKEVRELAHTMKEQDP